MVCSSLYVQPTLIAQRMIFEKQSPRKMVRGDLVEVLESKFEFFRAFHWEVSREEAFRMVNKSK